MKKIWENIRNFLKKNIKSIAESFTERKTPAWMANSDHYCWFKCDDTDAQFCVDNEAV